MKFISNATKKIALTTAGLLIAGSAFASGLAGTWQTFEDGQPKAIVTITESGGVYTGKITGASTPKAQQYVGRTVITGLRDEGGGKFGGGKITDPVNGKTYSLSATLNGNTLRLRGYLGTRALGRTQTWQRK